MYDLETLRYLNEQAYQRFLALSNEDRSASAPAAEEPKKVKLSPVFPLSVLARKLIGGPPSLGYFVELLEMSETFIGFRDLVREYLPAHEVTIMAEDLNHQALRFCQLFSEEFFPLSDDAFSEGFTLYDLLGRIPVQPLGASYESYHRFMDFREGYILALSLVESPFDEPDEDPDGMAQEDEEYGVAGGRVALLEHVGQLVGESLVRLMPSKGWSAEDLHRMTDGTEFEGLGDLADWFFSITGCYHLDAPGEEVEMGDAIEWSPGAVEDLTEDWQRSCEILDKMHRVALLLEQDSENNFRNLLGLLLDRDDLIIPKEQLPLPLG